MVWREHKGHFSDCYFSMTKIPGFSKKTKSKIKYPNCDSATKPVPHSLLYPVPDPPSIQTAFDSESETTTDAGTSRASEFEDFAATEKNSPETHFLTQGDLQDLARDLNLSKEKSEILASRLKQWNFLQNSVNITNFRKRHFDLKEAAFFCLKEDICYCVDMHGLMHPLDQEYEKSDWRLFYRFE